MAFDTSALRWKLDWHQSQASLETSACAKVHEGRVLRLPLEDDVAVAPHRSRKPEVS